MIRKATAIVLLAAGIMTCFAAPRIEVDSRTFNCGKVIEGKNSSANAKFTLTNTGTKPLRISNVRVSCGCTVLEYDPVIEPGKTSVIEPAVNIAGFRAGFISKTITIISNAANTPSLTLFIEADIVPAIEISEAYVIFDKNTSKTLYLASAKKDLKISGVVFKPQANVIRDGRWSSTVPLNLKYTLSAPDSIRSSDGFAVYKLDIESPGADREPVFGEFQITTNHPDKQEIKLRGRVDN